MLPVAACWFWCLSVFSLSAIGETVSRRRRCTALRGCDQRACSQPACVTDARHQICVSARWKWGREPVVESHIQTWTRQRNRETVDSSISLSLSPSLGCCVHCSRHLGLSDGQPAHLSTLPHAMFVLCAGSGTQIIQRIQCEGYGPFL